MPNNHKKNSEAKNSNMPSTPEGYPEGHPLGPDSVSSFYDEIVKRQDLVHQQCLERKNPQLAAKILWMLSQGRSRLSISRDTGVEMPIIRRLANNHSETVEQKRKEMAIVYAGVANQYVGLLQKKGELLEDDEEALKQTPPDKLGVVVGIMTDHYNKLTGMNTITIEHKRGATIDEAQATLAELRSRLAERAKNQSIEAEVISEQSE